MIYDALKMKFRELKLRKDPDCPVCGTHPTVTKLIDYDQFCGVVPAAPEPVAVNNATEITAVELKQRLDRGDKLQDCRRPRAQRISDQPDPGSAADSAGRRAQTLRGAQQERRDRRALQDGRTERQSGRFPAFRWVYARAQPQGRRSSTGSTRSIRASRSTRVSLSELVILLKRVRRVVIYDLEVGHAEAIKKADYALIAMKHLAVRGDRGLVERPRDR